MGCMRGGVLPTMHTGPWCCTGLLCGMAYNPSWHDVIPAPACHVALMSMSLQARETIKGTAQRLIDKWKQQHPMDTKGSDTSSKGAAAAAAAGAGPTAVSPGSFLGSLLAARHKASGEALSDAQVRGRVCARRDREGARLRPHPCACARSLNVSGSPSSLLGLSCPRVYG